MNNFEVAHAGVLLASKILEVSGLNIEFIDQKILPYKEICAMFIKNEFTIIFNEDWLNTSKHLDIMLTSFHEVRHAYQYLQTKKKSSPKFIEDEKLIEKWRYEFNSYHQPNSKYDLQYLQSDIEIDAIAFSGLLLKQLFNITILVHKEITYKYNRRLLDIKKTIQLMQ